jgi:hypothetical protein
LTDTGSCSVVGVKKDQVDVGSVVQLHRTELAERHDAELRSRDTAAFVRARWLTIAIVEVLASEAERVIKDRVGEVRQLFHRFDERVHTPNVVKVGSQQLAATKTSQKILWIE